jgi:hypothetical protein
MQLVLMSFGWRFVAGLLRVWVHAAGVHHFDHRDSVCDDRGNVLLAECGELSLAMDFLLVGGFHSLLRVLVLHLLLSHEDKDVRILPDQLLLRLHSHVLHRPWYILR